MSGARCSQRHQSFQRLPPSTWCADVAAPHRNPAGKRVAVPCVIVRPPGKPLIYSTAHSGQAAVLGPGSASRRDRFSMAEHAESALVASLERVGVGIDPGWRECVDAAWLEGWSPQTFDLGDGVTEVVTMGQGPPLVLVPPLPGLKEAWLAVAAPLARRFRVVTFDVRCR